MISYGVHEKILKSGFGWLAQKDDIMYNLFQLPVIFLGQDIFSEI